MFKKIALSVIIIALSVTTLAIASERQALTWQVTVHTCETPVDIKTYYLDNNNIEREVEWFYNWTPQGGNNVYTRTTYIWPPEDPPPLYMCVEAWTENYYDEDQTNDTSPPSELEVWLGIGVEPPGDEDPPE